MAIALKSSATGQSSTATVSVTTAETSATVVGDLVLVFHTNDFYALSAMATPTATGSPTMNAVANGTADAGATDGHIKTFWYIANTAGAQTIQSTHTGTADEEKAISALVFSDVLASDPIDDANNTFSNVGGPTNTAPAVGPSAIDSFLVAVVCSGGGAGTASYTTPAPLTELLEWHIPSLFSGVIATQQLSTSGTTGSFAFIPATSIVWCAVTVALNTDNGATAGPNQAGHSEALTGGSGSWTNPGNATGGDNDAYAVWTVP